MSRIGREPITIPAGVEVKLNGTVITAKGPKGTLTRDIGRDVKCEIEGNVIRFTRDSENKEIRSKHGLYRALVFNMVKGVTEGFAKSLIINGVGYKCNVSGNKLVLNIGYSHPIEMVEPEGITIDVKDNQVIVQGADKQLVGETAAKIRSLRVPDVYKGKGIKYAGEHLIIKEGKTGAKK